MERRRIGECERLGGENRSIRESMEEIEKRVKERWEAGVAEPGGGGQGGHGPPPKNLSGWAKVCFGPPKILTPGPLKVGVSGQTSSQIASEHPEICKIFKIFRLRRAYMGRTYSSAVDFMLFRANFFTL